MIRVSPPDEERELPGPHASSRVTRAPLRSRQSAVQPPKAPAPMTAICGLVGTPRLRRYQSLADPNAGLAFLVQEC